MLLFTTHHSLLTTHYSPLTIHYSLLTIRYYVPARLINRLMKSSFCTTGGESTKG